MEQAVTFADIQSGDVIRISPDGPARRILVVMTMSGGDRVRVTLSNDNDLPTTCDFDLADEVILVSCPGSRSSLSSALAEREEVDRFWTSLWG